MQPVQYFACRTEWLDTLYILKRGIFWGDLCRNSRMFPGILFGRAEGKHVLAKVVLRKWLLFGELRKREGKIHEYIKKRDGSLLRKWRFVSQGCILEENPSQMSVIFEV